MRKRKAEREKEGKKKEGGGRQGRKEEIKGGRRKERRKGNGREPKRRESSVLQLFATHIAQRCLVTCWALAAFMCFLASSPFVFYAGWLALILTDLYKTGM